MSTFLIVSIVTLCAVVLFLAKIYTQFTPTTVASRLHVEPLSFVRSRVDCDRIRTKCSSDSDCQTTCLFGLTCVQGACQSKYETKPCDVTKGKVATYQYIPSVGVYETLCLSVDPGVALDDDSNVYCQGGNTTIDYTVQYPNQCSCPEGSTLLPVWGNLNRRLTHGCTRSKLYQRLYPDSTVTDHV